MIVAGIDVAHKALALVIRRNKKNAKVQEFTNTATGHEELLKTLMGVGVERVCLDATGSYHLDLALDANEIALMVVHSKVAKRFAEALSTRTKTDPVDAAMLAEFAQRMPFEPWVRPAASALALRTSARRVVTLTDARTQAKNQMHVLSQTASTPAMILEDVPLTSPNAMPTWRACARRLWH